MIQKDRKPTGANEKWLILFGLLFLGHRGFLTLILYQWGSEIDRSINQQLTLEMPIIWNPFLQAIDSPPNLPQADNNGAQNAAAGDSVGSQGSVNGIENANHQVPANSNTAPVVSDSKAPLAYCGQACYGPIDSCDPLTGCNCIADDFQGGSSGLFSGRCGVVYSSTAIRGRRLRSFDIEQASQNLSFAFPSLTRVVGPSIGAAAASELTDTACPCNCTYVSHECCNSVDGIVREAAAKRLGALRMPDGVSCNTTTGIVENVTHVLQN